MYMSTVHTPASSCSAGTGVSCGPARSFIATGTDDFERQLKERLEAHRDGAGDPRSKDAAGKAAEKVSEWRRQMADLLDNCDEGVEDHYESNTLDELREEREINGEIHNKQGGDCSPEVPTKPRRDVDGDVNVEIHFGKGQEGWDERPRKESGENRKDQT